MIDRSPAMIVRCSVHRRCRGGRQLRARGRASCSPSAAAVITRRASRVVRRRSRHRPVVHARVTVDPGERIASAQGGALWRDLDAATHAHGLATTGGVISSTGVGGLTLRRRSRLAHAQHGLACDNARRRGDRDGRRHRPARQRDRERGSVLGGSRRRRQLRRRHDVRVPAAPHEHAVRRHARVSRSRERREVLRRTATWRRRRPTS